MMNDTHTASPFLALLDLGHQARAAASSEELSFLLVNDTRMLAPYRQAALWFSDSGIRTLSGVLQPESNAPYVQWLNSVCRALAAENGQGRPRRVNSRDLPPDIASEWQEWLPQEALWFPIPADTDLAGSFPGGLLLAGDIHFSDESLVLLEEWLDIWRHAWQARFKAPPWSLALLRRRFTEWQKQHGTGKWWQRRPARIALALLLLLLFPVRLTVLAQGELIPVNPASIRAPLDGVISKFDVRPNETVKKGQALFEFDEAPIASRLEVARQTLATAEAEYRQLAQMALSDAKSKGQLAVLLGKIGEKRADVDFLASQFERSRVAAPQDGIAIFDDPSEWIGRPVQTGERIMKIAQPQEAEIEAWLSIGDAIPLADDSPVDLYLAASPLSSLSGKLRYVGHDAVLRPDGTYAYRIRARLTDALSDHRIGLKGTAKLRGSWVPLCYWIFRRPLAVVRQFLAV